MADSAKSGASRELSFPLWVAQNPSCPPESLARIAARYGDAGTGTDYEDLPSPGAQFSARVAANPSCPPDLLAALSGHRYPSVRRAARTNPNCPARCAAYLAPGIYDDVAAGLERQRTVLKDPHIPAAVLDFMGDNADGRARAGVLAHPNTPTATIKRLAGDVLDEVRQAAADALARRADT